MRVTSGRQPIRMPPRPAVTRVNATGGIVARTGPRRERSNETLRGFPRPQDSAWPPLTAPSLSGAVVRAQGVPSRFRVMPSGAIFSRAQLGGADERR